MDTTFLDTVADWCGFVGFIAFCAAGFTPVKQ
jgi:hypothetical protein